MLNFLSSRQNARQPTPNSLSTAAQLPPELIILILEHALDGADDLQYRTRYFLLSSISRVSRSWGYQAQILLWSKIIVMNDKEGRALVKSRGLGRYSTEYLELSGVKVMPNTLAMIVKRVKGVRWLRLKNWAWHSRLQEKPFCYENLKDLEVLQLDNVVLHPSRQSLPLTTYPLKLRRLDITTHHSIWSSEPLASTFFGTQCSSITELKIHLTGFATVTTEMIDFLHLVGKNLKVLVLIVPTIKPLLPALATCEHLKDLTISWENSYDLPMVLRTLSCQLKSLAIRTKDFGEERMEVLGLLSVLRERSLREIEVVRFKDCEEAEFVMRCGGDEVRRNLRKKGVKVAFGSEEGGTDL